MPELPEVETTRRGIAPHVQGREIREVLVRQSRLRVPVPEDLADRLIGARLGEIRRRAKYLLLPVLSGEGGESVENGGPRRGPRHGRVPVGRRRRSARKGHPAVAPGHVR